MKKAIAGGLVLASIGLAACGSTTKVKTVTVADNTTPPAATTTPASNPNPPCSTEDATDSTGDNFCSLGSGGGTCPPGWTADATVDNECDASYVPPTTTDPSTSTSSSSSTNLTGPVGTPFTDTDAQNNEMSVTLTQVIDPAQGADSFTTPDNGKRFIGAKFTIKGMSGSFNDDANSDAVLIGSDGQSYTADFDSIAGCTNFNDGEYTVTSGQSTVGCVTFQIPVGVKVASIQWGNALGGGTPATWTL